MNNKLDCPPADVLQALIGGMIAEPESDSLIEHLEECEACLERANTLSPRDTLVDVLRGDSAAAAAIADDIPRPLIEKIKRLASHKSGDSSDTLAHADDSSPDPKDVDLGFLSAPDRPDELGRLGVYRILKVLGSGGMGMVFLAEDPELDRKVALKVMLPRIAAKSAAKTRFLREAKAAAKLRSDHIVTIFQVGEQSGVPYLAMELLDGMSLDDRLRTGPPLTLPQIVRIGREIAQGLAAAHDKGLIHRDIKPANLWLDGAQGDRVKILDFGLARSDADDVHITQSGAVVGTPAYMSPEQGRGENALDARADLFSLGCVLYRMCVGDIPFKAETTMGVLMAIALHNPPAPHELSDAIPPSLSELIMLLLEKDPIRRPRSAREVITRLAEIERTLPLNSGETRIATETRPRAPVDATASLSAERPAPRKRRPAALVLAALLFAGLIGWAGIVFFWQTEDGQVVRIECDDPSIKIAFDEGELKIVGAYKEPLSLRPGKHGLKIKRGDFEFETDKLIVNRGDKIALRIEVQKGKVQIVQAGKGVLDGKDLPTPIEPTPITGKDMPRFALRFEGQEDKVGPLPFALELSKPFTIEGIASVEPVPSVASHLFVAINNVNLRANAKKWEFNLRGQEKLSWHSHSVSTPLVPGKRSHVAGVFTGKDILLFVDGKLAGSKNVEKDLPHEGKVALTMGHRLNGTLGEVRVSQVARYLKEFTPVSRFKTDKDTLALYHCDENSGDKLLDSSGNEHHGKIVGAKWMANSSLESTPARAVAPFDAAKARADQAAWAKHLATEVEAKNSIGMTMVLIPPGEFSMGSAATVVKAIEKELIAVGAHKDHLASLASEIPQHRVQLMRPFQISAHEVTVGQFREFIKETKYVTDAERDGKGGQIYDPKTALSRYDPKSTWKNPVAYALDDKLPVTQVSWNDADAFCRWLAKKEGRAYRLPTEAEWEFASRAGTESRHSFGDNAFVLKEHVVLGDAPERIGSRKANAFGLYDMEGNVFEWCGDWVRSYDTHAQTDPTGAAKGTHKAFRGGSHVMYPQSCRPASRSSDIPSARTCDSGFRVVCELGLRSDPDRREPVGVEKKDALPTNHALKLEKEDGIRIDDVPSGETQELTMEAWVRPAKVKGLVLTLHSKSGHQFFATLGIDLTGGIGPAWMFSTNAGKDGKSLKSLRQENCW